MQYNSVPDKSLNLLPVQHFLDSILLIKLIFYLIEFIVWNIQGLQYWVAKIYGLEHSSTYKMFLNKIFQPQNISQRNVSGTKCFQPQNVSDHKIFPISKYLIFES